MAELKGRRQIPNLLRFGAILVHSHFPPLLLPSPLSSPTSPLFYFIPSLPHPKEANKKFSYRGQNALNVVKTHERNNDREHILYVSVRQSRLAGGIMFSTCPFVRPSVCLSVTNLWTLYLEIKWTDVNANCHKSSPGQGHKRSTSGVRRSKIKVTGGRSYFWNPGGHIILDPLSQRHTVSDINFVFKRGGGVAHSFNCTPAFVVYASCWRTC